MCVLQVVLAAGWKEVWKVVKAWRPVRRLESRGKNVTRNEGKAALSIPGLILVTAHGITMSCNVDQKLVISGQNLGLF